MASLFDFFGDFSALWPVQKFQLPQGLAQLNAGSSLANIRTGADSSNPHDMRASVAELPGVPLKVAAPA